MSFMIFRACEKIRGNKLVDYYAKYYFLNKTCQIPFGNLENSQQQPQCDFDGGDCFCSSGTDGKSVPCQGRGRSSSKKQAGKSCTLAKYQLSCLVIQLLLFATAMV